METAAAVSATPSQWVKCHGQLLSCISSPRIRSALVYLTLVWLPWGCLLAKKSMEESYLNSSGASSGRCLHLSHLSHQVLKALFSVLHRLPAFCILLQAQELSCQQQSCQNAWFEFYHYILYITDDLSTASSFLGGVPNQKLLRAFFLRLQWSWAHLSQGILSCDLLTRCLGEKSAMMSCRRRCAQTCQTSASKLCCVTEH